MEWMTEKERRIYKWEQKRNKNKKNQLRFTQNSLTNLKICAFNLIVKLVLVGFIQFTWSAQRNQWKKELNVENHTKTLRPKINICIFCARYALFALIFISCEKERWKKSSFEYKTLDKVKWDHTYYTVNGENDIKTCSEKRVKKEEKRIKKKYKFSVLHTVKLLSGKTKSQKTQTQKQMVNSDTIITNTRNNARCSNAQHNQTFHDCTINM